MLKVYLQKIQQYNSICYIGKVDPRILVRVATKVEMSEVQDAQRPLNEKRVKDIANYVGNENGILPNTLTLATNNNKYSIIAEADGSGYYVEFPNSEEEYPDYKDTIDVMDGQHRLYSFLPDIASIHEDVTYEIGFTLYIKPTLLERQKIFISCNEKQEKVSGNLLMWFKEKLNMLTDSERAFWNIVSKLSNEYPLKNHIIMSAERKKNAVKAKEVSAALKQAKIKDLSVQGVPLDDNQIVKVLCTYLSAWEETVGFRFSEPKRTDGAAIKMAGLKYMLLLVPTFWDKAVAQHHLFDDQFVKDTLASFMTKLGVEREEFFVCDDHKMNFRDRTAVDLFANQSINVIKGLDAGEFNPLG